MANHSKTELSTIRKPNKMAAIFFFTIQKPNFEMFSFRMDSVFECSEFEPPLYFSFWNRR